MITERELKKQVRLLHELRMGELPEGESRQQEDKLSDEFYQKMETLVARVECRERRKWLGGRIAVAACLALLLFNLVMPRYVTEAYRYWVQWFDDHVSFRFSEDIGEVEIPEYDMGYLPEGYEILERHYTDGDAGLIECSGNLYFTYMRSDGLSDVNNEGVKYYELTTDDGIVLYCFEGMEEEMSSVNWLSADKTTFFGLDGYLPMEELLKIQKNIVIKK
ncbi:MAG: hypothetical protein NC092_04370 [Butyrivibrio sp.]|nr:hypothetical protein [Muribaculum sp.]MCM1551911.1 hypothetical protein [Butyrivibrio sp.]